MGPKQSWGFFLAHSGKNLLDALHAAGPTYAQRLTGRVQRWFTPPAVRGWMSQVIKSALLLAFTQGEYRRGTRSWDWHKNRPAQLEFLQNDNYYSTTLFGTKNPLKSWSYLPSGAIKFSLQWPNRNTQPRIQLQHCIILALCGCFTYIIAY